MSGRRTRRYGTIVRDLAAAQISEVQPGAEASLLAGQEDHPDLGVLPHLSGSGEHVLRPMPPLSIEHLRLVKPDLAHGAVIDHPDPAVYISVLIFPTCLKLYLS
jgi:hypothetical protein